MAAPPDSTVPPLSPFWPRWRPALEIAAILISGAMLAHSAWINSEVYDERAHLNAGIMLWKTGDPAFDVRHPPLRALWVPLPALWNGPLPAHFEDPLPELDALSILLAGRLTAIAFYLFWCWTFGRIAARWLGPAPGFAALLLALFEPTQIAHANLATTDMLITTTAFWFSAAFFEWARAPRPERAAALGAAAALMALAKYSALLWAAGAAAGAVLLALMRLARADSSGRRALLRGAASPAAQWLAAIALAWFLVCMAYQFRGVGEPLQRMGFDPRGLGRFEPLLGRLPSPLPADYLRGVDLTMWDVHRAQYFAGRMSLDSFPLYFPALLLMKPPLALHALLLMAGAGLWARRRARRWDWLFFAVPVAGYLAYTVCAPTMQIGVRHILPVFPFLHLAAAWGAFACGARAWRAVGCALIGSVVILSLAIRPHHLAHFNPLAGGMDDAWRWFSDSNQDWGQGWEFIVRYAERAREEGREIHLDPVEGETTGWIAVSTNQLVGLEPMSHAYMRWLREDFERQEFIAPCYHLYFVPEDYWTAPDRER